jgi:RNA polymerase sigma-70 factor, ECF subfamily
LQPGTAPELGPEGAAMLREDVRFAVVAALQWVPDRQRAALILHEVYDEPLAEVGAALGINANAAKALVNRARAALSRARRRDDVDPVADRVVVEQLVRAIEQRSVAAFTALLDEDVWGLTDGGGILPVARKSLFGVRAVARGFANNNRRQPLPIAAHVRRLNGEPAAVVTVPAAANAVWASIHIETRGGRIAALRVVRDPHKLSGIAAEG